MSAGIHKLVVLDMAGTTVADGGLVEESFAAAARTMGADPESMIGYVRATMGESKISVFRHLFGGDEGLARTANSAFEAAYGERVSAGLIAPVDGAREAIEQLRGEGRVVVLSTGFARVTQDAILTALGWEDLADFTLCPADAGAGGGRTRTWCLPRFCGRGLRTACGRSLWPGTPRTTW